MLNLVLSMYSLGFRFKRKKGEKEHDDLVFLIGFFSRAFFKRKFEPKI